jgi:hypothetical protein
MVVLRGCFRGEALARLDGIKLFFDVQLFVEVKPLIDVPLFVEVKLLIDIGDWGRAAPAVVDWLGLVPVRDQLREGPWRTMVTTVSGRRSVR